MGVLDDAIKDHLDLKRQHGADEGELRKQEAEALGPARRHVDEAEPEEGEETAAEVDEAPAAEAEDAPAAETEVPVADPDIEPDEVPKEESLEFQAVESTVRSPQSTRD